MDAPRLAGESGPSAAFEATDRDRPTACLGSDQNCALDPHMCSASLCSASQCLLWANSGYQCHRAQTLRVDLRGFFLCLPTYAAQGLRRYRIRSKAELE